MAGGGGGSNTTHALLSPDPETLPIGGVSRPATGEFLEIKELQGQPTVAPYAPSTAGPNSPLSTQNKTFIKIPPLEPHTPQLPQHNIFSLNFISSFQLHHFSPPPSKTSRLCSKTTQAEPPPPARCMKAPPPHKP